MHVLCPSLIEGSNAVGIVYFLFPVNHLKRRVPHKVMLCYFRGLRVLRQLRLNAVRKLTVCDSHSSRGKGRGVRGKRASTRKQSEGINR